MSNLISPHGSETIKELAIYGNERKDEIERAKSLQKLELSSRELGDLLMMGIGGFTPIAGFMNFDDWKSVCKNMYLSNGIFWPIPIVLSTTKEKAKYLKKGSEIALTSGQLVFAIMRIEEKYQVDKEFECKSIFRTLDVAHPGVALTLSQGEINISGPVKVLSDGTFKTRFGNMYMTPRETRQVFESRGWKTVAAFQTRNPMHRSHEYLSKIALETCDGVLVHSLLGNLKAGDIPASVRVEAIDALLKNYFVPDTVIHSGYPLDMRYAGPREALLHAVFRQNYGCTHQIIGRDHAGVGSFYGPFDAHKIFDELASDALKIKPIKIDITFWCHKCGGMASTKTCPHDEDKRLQLSGTKLRQLLLDGISVPPEFSRDEVLKVLKKHYDTV